MLSFMVMLQVFVPEQPAPVQPGPKLLPVVDVAVNVTVVPVEKNPVQIEPQFIPIGLLVTVPAPVLLTVNEKTGRSARV